jgi:aspartyl-tRNA(Asn)/glutamyl-tRNA(Gln) amidotransferase subunit A
MGPLALGTDGGGSIRIPCSFTGLFGIKPSFGRVPAWPLSPFGTVAHVGPITRDVTDAALMLTVLSLPDARDWYALPYEPRDYRAGLDAGVRGLRIAYSGNLGYAAVDPEVKSIVGNAVKTFLDLGARVEETHPGFDNPEAIFRAHWFSGAAALVRTLKDTRSVDPGLLEVAAQGEKVTAAELLEAQMKRGALGTLMNLFHRDYDLLVTPTLAVPAFGVGREYPEGNKRWTDWTPFTYPFNLTGQPAASIPCGFTKAGLPVGLHIVGPRYADALVLRAARAFESARPIALPKLA